jgi:glycosyltransferase involved in cell wall biosynthesis
MNICFVIISDAWAGAETVVHELARHLRDKGNKVYIVSNQEIFKYYTDIENVNLFNAGAFFQIIGLLNSCLSPKIGTEEDKRTPDSSVRPFYLGALLREFLYKRIENKVAQIMTDNKIDIMHSHLNAGIVLGSRVANIPDVSFVATLHGLSVAGMANAGNTGWLRSPIATWRRQRFGRALNKANMVTAVSHAEFKAVEKCGISIKNKSVVIPNGVDIRELRDTPASPAPLKGEFNLLFPGGSKFVKGGDLLIRALPEVNERTKGIHLYVAGNVPLHHDLRKLASTLGLGKHITFTGFLEPLKYRQLLRSIDVLVMPSREEYFGIVFLEAMALGKPVIGGNTGGIPEVIKHGRNGVLVEPNVERIAEAIIYLYENEELRRKMSENNLQDVTEFDWDRIAALYINLYREVMTFH